MNLKAIQDLVYMEYVKNKYHEMWNGNEVEGTPSDITKLRIINITNLRIPITILSKRAEEIRKGYKSEYIKLDSYNFEQCSTIAELVLMVTEIQEAIDAVLSKDKMNLAEEMADLAIRDMNFCTRHGINLENEILTKHYTNLAREPLHGKKV